MLRCSIGRVQAYLHLIAVGWQRLSILYASDEKAGTSKLGSQWRAFSGGSKLRAIAVRDIILADK